MKFTISGFLAESFEHDKSYGEAGRGQVECLVNEKPIYKDRKLTIEISEKFHKKLLRDSHDLKKIKLTIETI